MLLLHLRIWVADYQRLVRKGLGRLAAAEDLPPEADSSLAQALTPRGRTLAWAELLRRLRAHLTPDELRLLRQQLGASAPGRAA